jgi:class 3 adenylate cyclase
MADEIPHAQFVEIAGTDHAPWFADPDGISAATERFLTGARNAPPQTKRSLRTILFTDVVGSTECAARLGDDRWRAVLERYREVNTQCTDRFEGRVVKSTGDGFLSTFEGPTSAIRCAQALIDEVQALGIRIRAGLHTGECELLGDDIGGIAVHIAARILEYADADQIVATSVVRDLVVGSGIGFNELGAKTLKGVPGDWVIVQADPQAPASGSPEAQLASIHTPAAATSMRRIDKIARVLARRTPRLTRAAVTVAPKVMKDTPTKPRRLVRNRGR